MDAGEFQQVRRVRDGDPRADRLVRSYGGVKLTPPRIALVLGLLHMALAHVRNVEIFALLLPIVVLAPVASQFALRPAWTGRTGAPMPVMAVVMVLLGGWTWLLAANTAFAPPESHSPAAAVDALKAHNSKRVLNDLPFGGYLIWRQIPVFIDGRAELYGEAFDIAYYRAMQLKDVNQFPRHSQAMGHRCRAADAAYPGGWPARSYRRLAARLCR